MDCSPPDSPLSMGFSRQEYWSGLPFPSPRLRVKCQKKYVDYRMRWPDFGLKHLLPSSLLSLVSLRSVPLQELWPQCRRNLLNPRKKPSKSIKRDWTVVASSVFLTAGFYSSRDGNSFFPSSCSPVNLPHCFPSLSSINTSLQCACRLSLLPSYLETLGGVCLRGVPSHLILFSTCAKSF